MDFQDKSQDRQRAPTGFREGAFPWLSHGDVTAYVPDARPL